MDTLIISSGVVSSGLTADNTRDILVLGGGNAELAGIGLELGKDLFIAASYGLIINGKTGTTQLRQNAVCQFTEAMTQILDLLFALLRILIHGEHTQDDILILNVRCSD